MAFHQNVFGNEHYTVPLSFDRVNEGRCLTSRFILFRLPIELFRCVTPYLSPSDLSSLALVDRDCRQLAQSVQFAEFTSLYGELNPIFLDDITNPNLRSVRTCIRRLNIGNINRNYTGVDSLQSGKELIKHMEDACLEKICRITQNSLSNLHILDWSIFCTLSPQMIAYITTSQIKHLRLSNVRIGKDYAVGTEQSCTSKFELATLVINFADSTNDSVYNSIVIFLHNLLGRCAKTLCRLEVRGDFESGENICYQALTSLSFPNLQDLTLAAPFPSSMYTELLGKGTKLRSLLVNDRHTHLLDFLCSRGQIPTLESLYWQNVTNSRLIHHCMLEFVQSNPQIANLRTSNTLPISFLDSRLIPALQNGFHDLSCLHLWWDSTTITRESLSAIGSITSIEHLWLSVGSAYGYQLVWEIDHETLLATLRSLRNLRSIGFLCDSYRVNSYHPLLGSSVSVYYVEKVLPQDVLNSIEWQGMDSESLVTLDEALQIRDQLISKTWEKWHQARMIDIASKYAKVFINLNWCFIGQLEIEIKNSNAGKEIGVVCDSRDPCGLSLRRKWSTLQT